MWHRLLLTVVTAAAVACFAVQAKATTDALDVTFADGAPAGSSVTDPPSSFEGAGGCDYTVNSLTVGATGVSLSAFLSDLVINITPGLTPIGVSAPGQKGDPFAGMNLAVVEFGGTNLWAGNGVANIKFVGGHATAQLVSNAKSDSTALVLSNIWSNPKLGGDCNNDGLVDVADYNLWAANVGRTGATWWQGDFNGDGLVDVADYNIWAANVGKVATGQMIPPYPNPAIVPEPITFLSGLMVVSGLWYYVGRRTRVAKA